MLIQVWAFALLFVFITKFTNALPSDNSFSSLLNTRSDSSGSSGSISSESGNIGISKTYPLKASQKISKRELAIRSATFTPIDSFIAGSKLAVDPDSNINISSSEGSVLVDQDGHDISYYIEVELGTGEKGSHNMQIFNLVIDTGSFYTWVYGTNCNSVDCSVHTRFDAKKSTTAQTTNNNFSIAYTSGTVKGVITKDLFSFAGFQSPQQFGLASVVDSSFAHFSIDGILGLPARDKSPKDFPGVVSTLYNQKLISKPIFGINLGRGSDPNDEGSFSIGGIDQTKYTGDITYISLNNGSSSLFWEIPIAGVFIEGYSIDLGGSRTAIVDTGTTLLVMPPEDALKLHGYISGTRTDGSNFVIPCNTSLKLEFEFNNKKFVVSPEDYVGVAYSQSESGDDSDSLCISNIQGMQFDNNRWILGDVFLKNVYSVYDMEEHRVGFGTKITNVTNETPKNSFVYAMTNSGNNVKKPAASSSSSGTISDESSDPSGSNDDKNQDMNQTNTDFSDSQSANKNTQAPAVNSASDASGNLLQQSSTTGSVPSSIVSSRNSATTGAAKSTASHNLVVLSFNLTSLSFLILLIFL